MRGVASGAIGFVADTNNNPNTKSLVQTTGTFIEGETVIVNEIESDISPSILTLSTYTTDDIKSVFQLKAVATLASNFSADSVLYDRVLPNFSLTDNLSVLGGSGTNTATVANRRFSGKVGIKTDAIIAYNHGTFADPVFNRVSSISANGEVLTLSPLGVGVTGVNQETILAAGISTNSAFRIKVPRITNLSRGGLYSRLPKKNVSIIDTSKQ